jgi:hypothetical protein
MTPGVYTDLSNMAYHAETDWVSSSMLKRLLPEWYGPEPKNQDALWFGSAFHTRVLGGPSEPVAVADYPTWQSKAAKEFSEDAVSRDHIPLLLKDVALIDAMTDSLKNHSEASNLIWGTGGQSEVSVFAEVDSVPSRARCDRLLDDGVIVDVKTTAKKPNPGELDKAVTDFGYELSEAHYRSVLGASQDLDPAGFDFVLVFVGKEEPHHVTVCRLDEGFKERGRKLVDLALQRFLHGEFTPAYPGASGTLELALPRWAKLD